MVVIQLSNDTTFYYARKSVKKVWLKSQFMDKKYPIVWEDGMLKVSLCSQKMCIIAFLSEHVN